LKIFLTILCAGLLIAGISGSSEKRFKASTIKTIKAKDTSSFVQDIEPILIKNCSPCHFPGGKVYSKMPFDAPMTIVGLKKERVLMRIKDENQKETVRKYIETNQ
jgi:hypothetical protein